MIRPEIGQKSFLALFAPNTAFCKRQNAFTEAWEAGQLMNCEQAIEYAFGEYL